MKKYLLSISALATMLAMAPVFTACSSDDDEQPSSTVSLTLNAMRDSYAGNNTRTVTLEDEKLVTSWKIGQDQISVYKQDWTAPIGNLSPIVENTGGDILKTKLDGTVSSDGMGVGDRMELIMPRTTWAYTGQDGTIATISKNFDYAIANASILYFDQSKKIYASNAIFKTQQAIVKYTLVDKDNKPLKVSKLSIVADGGKLVQSRNLLGTDVTYGGIEVTSADATNVFYVALRNDKDGGDKYTLTVKINDIIYTSKSPNEHTYTWGTYRKHTVTMQILDDTYTERDGYINVGDEAW